MSRLMVLGATGSLGKHVVRQALALKHEVSVLVRTPSKVEGSLRSRISVHECDLDSCPPAALSSLLDGHDVVINTAGTVTDGQRFVDLADRVVTGLEAIAAADRPVCWFMAGVGVLDIDRTGRRGVDLPRISTTYWPHRFNFERIQRSSLDWRVLCPGPMVEGAAIGLDRIRVSTDRLPVAVPSVARILPGPLLLPLFGYRIPEMIIPYADAACLLLANLAPESVLSRHRVGLALPLGMRGRKDQWIAKPGSVS